MGTDRPPRLPWEIVVSGSPSSVQSKGKRPQDWRQRVRAAAGSAWPSNSPPWSDDVAAVMVIFDFGQVGDIDNKIKHTLDALVELVLTDDRQVQQVFVARQDLTQPWRLDSPSPILVGAIEEAHESQRPFVFLRLHEPRPLEEVLDEH